MKSFFVILVKRIAVVNDKILEVIFRFDLGEPLIEDKILRLQYNALLFFTPELAHRYAQISISSLVLNVERAITIHSKVLEIRPKLRICENLTNSLIIL